MFSMATRIFPVETNRTKAFRRDLINHFDCAFWLGCAFRNCRLYCVFFRIAPPPCLRSWIECYACVAIYLFNLAPAKLHCLRNIRKFTSEIYSQRWHHHHFFTISSTADVFMSIESAFALMKVLPIILVWSKKTSRYDHFGAEILRYRARISVG